MERHMVEAHKAKFVGDAINCEASYKLWQFEKSAVKFLKEQDDIPDTIGKNDVIIIEADLMIGLISGVILTKPTCSIIDKNVFVDTVSVYRQNNINMNLLAAMNQYSSGHTNDIFTYKVLWFAKKKDGPVARVSYVMKFFNEDDTIYKYLDKEGGISSDPELSVDDQEVFTLMCEAFTRSMKNPDICIAMNKMLENENLKYNPATDDFEELSGGDDEFSDFINGLSGFFHSGDSDEDDE